MYAVQISDGLQEVVEVVVQGASSRVKHSPPPKKNLITRLSRARSSAAVEVPEGEWTEGRGRPYIRREGPAGAAHI
jgi:hypothetical protein